MRCDLCGPMIATREALWNLLGSGGPDHFITERAPKATVPSGPSRTEQEVYSVCGGGSLNNPCPRGLTTTTRKPRKYPGMQHRWWLTPDRGNHRSLATRIARQEARYSTPMGFDKKSLFKKSRHGLGMQSRPTSFRIELSEIAPIREAGPSLFFICQRLPISILCCGRSGLEEAKPDPALGGEG